MRIFVSLKQAEATRLSELAERERRHPRDQAAYLIACGLDRAEADNHRHGPEATASVSVPAEVAP